MRDKWWGKLLRIVGIVLMSLAAAFTLLGGVGTTCVALNPTGFAGSFAGIASFQWLWILFVLFGIAIGVMGVRAVVMLIKGRKQAYRASIIALLLSIALNAIHVIASRALRRSSMPVDGVLYTNVLTLIVFLIFRIPKVWQGVDFEKPDPNQKTDRFTSGAAFVVVGLLALTIQFMMSPTHTINGINYANAWHTTMTMIGVVLILAGVGSVVFPDFHLVRNRTAFELKEHKAQDQSI